MENKMKYIQLSSVFILALMFAPASVFVLVFTFTPASLFSQTAITLAQLQILPPPATGTYKLLVLSGPLNDAKWVELGDGVSVVNGKLTVIGVEYIPVRQRLTRATDGTYPDVRGDVARNGLAQLEGQDFARVGGRLVPSNKYPAWVDTDTVTVLTLVKAVTVPPVRPTMP